MCPDTLFLPLSARLSIHAVTYVKAQSFTFSPFTQNSCSLIPPHMQMTFKSLYPAPGGVSGIVLNGFI